MKGIFSEEKWLLLTAIFLKVCQARDTTVLQETSKKIYIYIEKLGK